MKQNKQSVQKCLEQITNILMSSEKSNIRLFNFLYELELDDLCEIANVIDSTLIDLDKKTWHLINFIDVETRIEILDDLYYDNIKDYKQYIYEKLEVIEKYLDNDISKYINELFNLKNETQEINDKRYIRVPLTDKEALRNTIIEVCESLMEFKKEYLEYWNFFGSPSRPYAYQVMKLLVQDLKKYISKVKIDLQENKDYKKILIEIANDLKIMLEEATGLIIDTNKIFKENISQEHYKILEQYNCLEKIGLIKYPSIYSIDLADVCYFFKNTKILKIIDGEKEYLINEGKPNKIYIVNLRKDFDELGFNELEDDLNKDVEYYNCDDCVVDVKKGNNKKLIILVEDIENI